MTVRVLVVDDNPVIRIGVTNLLSLSETLVVVGDAVNGDEAIEKARLLRPDVVLLDVRMPGSDGLGAIPDLAAIGAVLMLTHSTEPGVITEALAKGATGYLVHGSFTSDELVAAVHDTAQSRMRLSPEAATAVVARGMPASAATVTAGTAPAAAPPSALADVSHLESKGLSAREVEIMRLVVQGLGNQDVARRLFIEPKTVKNHMNRIFSKLGVSSRAQAIALCLGLRADEQ